MPKIPALPPMTTIDTADQIPIEDVSTSTTKYITLTKLKEWLQSLTGWITTAMIGNNQVTATKIDLGTLPWEITGLYYQFYTRPSVSMTSGNSATDTVNLPRAIASGENVIVIPHSQTWCHVEINQPTSGSTVSVIRNNSVTSASVTYRLSAIYYKAH